MQPIKARVLDSAHLELMEPIQMPTGSNVIVMIMPADVVEMEVWHHLSAQVLAAAYGDKEPEYSVRQIKANQDYKV